MLGILASVAQEDSYLRTILLKSVTTDHLSLLFELFEITNCTFQRRVLQVLSSLLDNKLPSKQFDEAALKANDESKNCKLANMIEKPFVTFLLNQVVQIRSAAKWPKGSYDLSRYVVRLLTTKVCT